MGITLKKQGKGYLLSSKSVEIYLSPKAIRELREKPRPFDFAAALKDFLLKRNSDAEIKKIDLLSKYEDYSIAINTITNMMKQDNDDKMKLIANMKA
jgi:hypothetical protein